MLRKKIFILLLLITVAIFFLANTGIAELNNISNTDQNVPVIPEANKQPNDVNINGEIFKAEWNKQTRLLKRVYGRSISLDTAKLGISKLSQDNIELATRAFIENNKEILKIDSSQLRLLRADYDVPVYKDGRDGIWNVYYEQCYKDIPVSGSSIGLTVNNGKVVLIDSDFYPGINISVVPGLSEEEAINIVKANAWTPSDNYSFNQEEAINIVNANTGIPSRDFTLNPIEINDSQDLSIQKTPELITSSLIIYPEKGNNIDYTLAWKVGIENEAGSWIYFVNANTGEIIDFHDARIYASISGKVTGMVYELHPKQAPISVDFEQEYVSIGGGPYNAAYYSGKSNYSQMMTVIDLRGVSSAYLTFSTKYSIEPGDRFYAIFSLDGESWSGWYLEGEQPSWTTINLNLASYIGKIYLFKFVYVLDSDSVVNNGFYVDNIVVNTNLGTRFSDNGENGASKWIITPLYGFNLVNLYSVTSTASTDSNGFYNLDGLSGSYTLISELKGQYVDVFNADRKDSIHTINLNAPTTHNWNWDTYDTSDRNVESNTFYHVNKIHNFFTRGSPFNIFSMDYQMVAIVNSAVMTNVGFNAFYSLNTKNIYFGAGNDVFDNLALSSDIIYHEYTHGVVDHIYPEPLPYTNQSGALNEGWADYFACTINNNSLQGDGIFKKVPYLRNIDNTNSYPDNYTQDKNGTSSNVHNNSLIVSGAVWDLKALLGKDLSDELIIRAIKKLPLNFVEFAEDLLIVDDDNGNLYDGTPHLPQIKRAFTKHGIKSPFFYPDSINNLSNTTGNFWIKWTWTNPSDPDFNHTMIYINSKWVANTSSNYYNLTDLTSHNKSTISIRTVDIYGNINNSYVTQTTQIPNNPVFIIDVPATKKVNENEELFVDANAIDLDGDAPVFSCNNTSLFKDFNAATGKGNFTPSFSQSGIYVVEFSVSDGIWGSTSNKSMIITVINVPLAITSQWNDYTNSSSVSFDAERLSTIFFNITTNRTHAFVKWYLNDSLQQNSPALSWIKKFDSTGIQILNVSAIDQYDTTFNSTWRINIEDNTPPPSVAGLSSDIPAQTTVNLTWNAITGVDDLWGYEVFKDGKHLGYTRNNYFGVTGLSAATNYDFKVRANDTYENWGVNSSVLTVTTRGPPPSIISWGNNITNNKQINITVERLASVNFNAIANQGITTWNWFKDGVNQNINNDNTTLNWNTIGLKTVKVNAANANGISNTITWNVTVQDTTPPEAVSNLKNTTGNFWIKWTWTNPTNDDFSFTMVYINDVWKANTSGNYYDYTSLSPHNKSKISTKTVDIYGNIDPDWIEQTTQVQNNNITIFDLPSTKTINENETLFLDAGATDLDGDTPVFSCNRTDLFKDFNIATGKGNFTPTYAQSGVYHIDFGASDGYGSVSNKTITITVIDVPLTITSYWNNKTGSSLTTACWQKEAIQFGVTTNRIANAKWYYDNNLEPVNSLNYTKQFTASGTHYFNVSAYDQYDRTSNITFTVTVPVITANEVQTRDHIQANNSTTFVYSDTSIVNSISIITNTNLTDVSIKVQELANVSTSLFTVNVGGTQHAHFNITSVKLTDADLTSINITFAVNKTWLQNSGLDPNNVKLNRYYSNSWEAYSASKINETSTNLIYTAKNVQGLSIFAVTAFAIPTPVSSSEGGGGGGGGGGAAPGEPQENVADKEVRRILTIKSDRQNMVPFNDHSHHILELSFAYSQIADDVSVTLEKLINSSLLANGTAQGIAFENINIWVDVPNPGYISNASVKFCVEKSWIKANNIDSNSIALYRFKDGAWKKLSTSKISENETLIFYLAFTPGFSPFAITGEKVSTVPVTTTLSEPAEIPPLSTATPTPATPTPTKPAPGFDLIVAAIGVMIVKYLWKRSD